MSMAKLMSIMTSNGGNGDSAKLDVDLAKVNDNTSKGNDDKFDYDLVDYDTSDDCNGEGNDDNGYEDKGDYEYGNVGESWCTLRRWRS